MSVLELIELKHNYGDVTALDGLSFVVQDGEMLGFVGPNGAGKTTAMRVILGLLEPSSGEVRWRGQEITEEVRRRFGYMPEERGLYPKMRVKDHLVYLALISGLDKRTAPERAEFWIDRLSLAQRASNRVEELSLGNQQRVQLAAALIHEPELLVLDEPFSGLDPVGVDVLSGVLLEQVTSGVPVMFSSHQLELVERICDSVAIINRGRLVATGRVGELLSSSDRRLVRVKVAGSNGWIQSLSGATVVEQDHNGEVIELGRDVDAQSVLDAARAAGHVEHFEVVHPRLTDLFREVVER
ncbi:MAG: ATP-binding cassette domain-containing protein [Actinomycetota bacterium]|nr:ATP-binding cassette domain-containing protein [Actinomycetota bacterium]